MQARHLIAASVRYVCSPRESHFCPRGERNMFHTWQHDVIEKHMPQELLAEQKAYKEATDRGREGGPLGKAHCHNDQYMYTEITRRSQSY